MKNNNDILSTDTIGIKHAHQSRQTGRTRSRRRAIDREVAEHSAHDRLSPSAKTHIDSANETMGLGSYDRSYCEEPPEPGMPQRYQTAKSVQRRQSLWLLVVLLQINQTSGPQC